MGFQAAIPAAKGSFRTSGARDIVLKTNKLRECIKFGYARMVKNQDKKDSKLSAPDCEKLEINESDILDASPLRWFLLGNVLQENRIFPLLTVLS